MSDELLLLQQAVLIRLQGDAALGAMVSGVYTHVPQDADFPYVHLRADSSKAQPNPSYCTLEVKFVLDIYSQYGGIKEITDIQERLFILLQDYSASLGGDATMLPLGLLLHLHKELSDGKTKFGSSTFDTVVQMAAA